MNTYPLVIALGILTLILLSITAYTGFFGEYPTVHMYVGIATLISALLHGMFVTYMLFVKKSYKEIQ